MGGTLDSLDGGHKTCVTLPSIRARGTYTNKYLGMCRNHAALSRWSVTAF